MRVYNVAMVACIILSAGASRRFGSPKALANLQGEPVIGRLQKLLIGTPVNEIVVVLGAKADLIKPHLLDHIKVRFVYNKDYNLGQTSSFRSGLESISDDVDGVLALPVDYPLIKADTILTLIEVFSNCPKNIVIPAFGGKKGHPPVFPMCLRDELMALKDTCGLNTVVQSRRQDTVIVPVDDAGVTMTFNTPEEFEMIAAQSLFKNND